MQMALALRGQKVGIRKLRRIMLKMGLIHERKRRPKGLTKATTTDSYVTQVNDDCVIRIGPNTDAVIGYVDNEGYPLKDSMKDNIETLKRYGKYRNKDSTVLVVNDIISRLDKGGYKWID